MSDPLGTIIKGNLLIEVGHDTTEFGFGDANINRSLLTNSGFATSSANVSLNATTSSNFTTNSGTLTLQSSDSTATGIVSIISDGTNAGGAGAGALDLNATSGGISLDAIKSSNFTITSTAAQTMTFKTTGHIGNKILIDTATSTATDAIKIFSEAGGIRLDSDGAAGTGTGIVMTSIDDSSLTTSDGKIRLEVASATVGDNLELVNTNGTSDGSSGAGAVDINAPAGGFSIDALKSSNITLTTSAAETLTLETSGDAGNKVLVKTNTSTASDSIKLLSSLGGIRIDSDGVAGGANGVIITAIDDSEFTTSDGKLLLHVNSATVTDNLEIKNTAGTADGTTGAGAIDIDAVAGGFSIDAIKSSNITLTSIAAATLHMETTGSTGNKILLETNNSTEAEAIKLLANNGGIRIDSDGAAGSGTGVVITAIDDSSFTTSDGQIDIHVNSATVTDDLILRNTGGTNITAVDIDAVAGGFSIDSVKDSNMTVTSAAPATLTIKTTGDVGNKILIDAATSTQGDAIKLFAEAGGIQIDADGAAGAGTGVIITAIDDSSFTTTDGQIDIHVNSLTETDDLIIRNSNGNDLTAVDIDASSGGISIDSVKSSNFTITSLAAATITSSSVANPSEITTSAAHGYTTGDSVTISGHTGSTPSINNTYTITVTGANTFTIPEDVTVGGTGGTVTPAASTLTLSTTGNISNKILIDAQTSNQCDAIKLFAEAGGIEVDADGTQPGCGIVMTSVEDSSWTISGGDLTLEVASSDPTDDLIITNTNGTNASAIDINATAGGIDIDASGGDGNSPISIDTNDTSNGITIATATAGVPVLIGTATSTTTIAGDLTVNGTTTTIDTETLTIEDNIILVNSGPTGSSDGGMAVKRFQGWNDACTGDVVSDVPKETSTQHAADTFAVSATATTIVFNNTGATPPSAVNDYYNGWWICITAGTGINQTRRIKDYDGTTRTATIFSTADETADPQSPATGSDWTVTPDNTSVYELFACPYVVSIYDESTDQWVLGCSATDPATGGEVTIQHYLDLHVGDTIIEGDLTVTGTINGVVADVTEVVTLVDNSTTPVNITSTEVYGAYMLLVKEVDANSLTANVVTTGAFASFSACARSGKAGNYVRLANARGADNERLDITYAVGEKVKLQYQPDPAGTGANRYYLVKIIRL